MFNQNIMIMKIIMLIIVKLILWQKIHLVVIIIQYTHIRPTFLSPLHNNNNKYIIKININHLNKQITRQD